MCEYYLFIFALVLTQQSQIVQLFGHIWMITSKHLLSYLKGALTQRLSVLVAFRVTKISKEFYKIRKKGFSFNGNF
jgi:hypothetical protein